MPSKHLRIFFVTLLATAMAKAQIPAEPAGGANDAAAVVLPDGGERRTPAALDRMLGAPTIEAGADGCVVRAPDYEASFSAAGASFRCGRDTELRTRLVAIERQGWARSTEQTRPRNDATSIAFDHAGVVERYEIGARHLEQTFRFDDRPAGRGDLVLRVAVAGSVSSPVVAPRHGPVRFVDTYGNAVIYGAAVAIGADGARELVATAYDGNGMLTLTVPAAFVESAAFPLLVDPVIASHVTSAIDNAFGVAYDAVGEEHFLASSSLIVGLYARRRSSDGTLLTSREVPTIGFAVSVDVAVLDGTFLGRRCLIATQEMDWPIDARRVMVRGLDPVTLIDTGVVAVQRTSGRVSVPTLTVGQNGDAAVAWVEMAAEGFFVRARAIRFGTTPGTAAQPLLGPTVTIESWSSSAALVPSVARDVSISSTEHAATQTISGQSWSVSRLVWTRFYSSPAPGDFDIVTCRIRFRNGSLFAMDAASPIPGADQTGVQEIQPDAAAMASRAADPTDLRALVVWQSRTAVGDDVEACLFGPSGTPGPVIAVESSLNPCRSPVVGGGATDFTVCYAEQTGPDRFRSRAARVLGTGELAVSHRTVVPDEGWGNCRMKVTSRPLPAPGTSLSNRVAIVTQQRTASGSGSTWFQLFEPVAPTASTFGVGCAGPWGFPPRLQALDEAFPGNSDFGIELQQAPPGALAVLMIGNGPGYLPIPGAPGCILYIATPAIAALPAVVDPTARAQVDLPVPVTIQSGLALSYQWLVATPGWNEYGAITSNVLDVTWSH